MEYGDNKIRETKAHDLIKEYGGIFPPYTIFYIQSMLYAVDRSNAAFQRYENSAKDEEPPTVVYSYIHEALTHTGALSRFLWPMKKNNLLSQARGKRLREVFKVSEASPLKDRRLRNAF